MIRELAAVLEKPLSVVFERLCKWGEVLDDWRKTNVPILKNGQEVCTGKRRPADLTLDPGKIMEQGLLENIFVFVKGKAFGCLTNLNGFYDKINGIVDDAESVFLAHL